MRLDFGWSPTPHARRTITIAALCLVLGAATGRPAVSALAAVPLALLSLGSRRPPSHLTWAATMDTDRCFEGDTVRIRLAVRLPCRVDLIVVSLDTDARVEVDSRRADWTRVREVDWEVAVTCSRWGHYNLGDAVVEVYASGRLLSASRRLPIGELSVFPYAPDIPRLSMRAARLDISGDHLSRQVGAGVEFAGLRSMEADDDARRINWRATARAGRPLVTLRTAERAVDVVLLLDLYDDVGHAGSSSLDLTLHGATAVCRRLLRVHDRVGLLTLGGLPRWLRPTTGERQYYRIVEAILDGLRVQSYVEPDLRRITHGSVPSGALVLGFTPLLDDRVVESLVALRGLGHRVVCIDVLSGQPSVHSDTEMLARRLWRLQRAATDRVLTSEGVETVRWDGQVSLTMLLAPLLRAVESGARR